jgi:hypothetical protein
MTKRPHGARLTHGGDGWESSTRDKFGGYEAPEEPAQGMPAIPPSMQSTQPPPVQPTQSTQED